MEVESLNFGSEELAELRGKLSTFFDEFQQMYPNGSNFLDAAQVSALENAQNGQEVVVADLRNALSKIYSINGFAEITTTVGDLIDAVRFVISSTTKKT